MSPDLMEWREPNMKTCSECNAEVTALLRSGLVPNEVCGPCHERLANIAIAKATGQRNPEGDKPGVTTKTVEAAVKESVK